MKNDGYTPRFPLRRWLVALALGCVWLSARADAFSSGIAGHTWVQNGNTWAIGAPTSTPSIPASLPTGVPASRAIGNFESTFAANQPAFRAVESIPLPGGRRLALTAANQVSKADAAAAIGRFAGSTAKGALGVLMVGVALYDLAKDLGYVVDYDPSGTGLSVSKTPAGACTSACYTWRTYGQAFSDAGSQAASCDAFAAHGYGGFPAGAAHDLQQQGSSWYCHIQYGNGGLGSSYQITTVAPRDPDAPTPSTLADLQNSIASQAGWPDSAQRALRDAVAAGQAVPVSPATVTGPASSPGPTTTSTERGVDPVTGKPGTATTTKTTTYNNNYGPSSVTINNIDNSTRVWNFDDGTTATQTSSETKEPDKPDDPCDKSNDTVGCAKLDTPDGKVPKQTKELTYSPETVSVGSNACPADIVSTIHGKAVTIYSYASTCDTLANKVRPIVLAVCALIAYLILMPGGREATS